LGGGLGKGGGLHQTFHLQFTKKCKNAIFYKILQKKTPFFTKFYKKTQFYSEENYLSI